MTEYFSESKLKAIKNDILKFKTNGRVRLTVVEIHNIITSYAFLNISSRKKIIEYLISSNILSFDGRIFTIIDSDKNKEDETND